MRHLRETGQKVVIANAKAGDAVERIGDDVDAARKSPKQQPLIARLGAKARANLAFRVGVQVMSGAASAELAGRAFADLADIDTVITDVGLDVELAEDIENAGPRVVVV